MTRPIIDLYNEELLHLRTEVAEFADEYRDRAGRLSLRPGQTPDPYVERLLEGVAYLAARVRLKLDAQYPVFTQQLVELLFPGWLAPSPSACILQIDPNAAAQESLQGVSIPRGSSVVGRLNGRSDVRCNFRTARDLWLWPLAIRHVRYVAARSEHVVDAFRGKRPASWMQVELDLTTEGQASQLGLDRLLFYVAATEPFGTQLMELMAGHCLAVSVAGDASDRRNSSWLDASQVCQLGFGDDEAMFPSASRGHAGFRVLKEYAALPEKFRFIEVSGLQASLLALKGRRVVLTFYFSSTFSQLEGAVRADSLALHCVPAVNLSEQSISRIDVVPGRSEFPVVAEHSDPREVEVVQLLEVRGTGEGRERRFRPVFESVASGDVSTDSFYAIRRSPRLMTQNEQRRVELEKELGGRKYAGADLFISLSEPTAAPHGADLKHLSIRALCANRDAPYHLRKQATSAHYAFVDAFPVKKVRCVSGPSEMQAAKVDGIEPWTALSHLFVNHLSLFDAAAADAEGGGRKGAEALRAMLRLYASSDHHELHRQAGGLESVSVEQVTRRFPGGGPLAFGRGVEVRLGMSDRAFHGGSPFMLGAVLEHYLRAHVSINTFIETRLDLVDRSEHLRWPARFGRRPTF